MSLGQEAQLHIAQSDVVLQPVGVAHPGSAFAATGNVLRTQTGQLVTSAVAVAEHDAQFVAATAVMVHPETQCGVCTAQREFRGDETAARLLASVDETGHAAVTVLRIGVAAIAHDAPFGVLAFLDVPR